MIYPNLPKLIDALIDVYLNEKYLPVYVEGRYVTYCNMALHDIMKRFGYDKFKDRLANDIIDIIKNSPEYWLDYRPFPNKEQLNSGYLIVACEKIDPHGHVVVLRPGEFVYSNKWDMYVPKCLNIGKTNFINKGINWAFDKLPYFYMFVG